VAASGGAIKVTSQLPRLIGVSIRSLSGGDVCEDVQAKRQEQAGQYPMAECRAFGVLRTWLAGGGQVVVQSGFGPEGDAHSGPAATRCFPHRMFQN
jgi:hypothetical protein